jgi:pimeloyl-ACP methyl ester carboxylesterase
MGTHATTALVGAAAGMLLLTAFRRGALLLRVAPASGLAMTGRLFRYKNAQWPAPLQAFESPAEHTHDKFCIVLGGLTDGLLACSYAESLGAALDKCGWAMVQPVLSSSYSQYGTGSVHRDAEELAELLSHLSERATAFAIVGHSTGCQDAVTLLARAPVPIRQKLRAAILQAPVSDREAAALDPEEAEKTRALLAEAEGLIREGKGDSLLSEKHYGFVPLSAERFASLAGRMTADDMFSSDLSDEELRSKLGHMGTHGQRQGEGMATEAVPTHPGLRTLFVHSGADEYVPATVDVQALSARLVAAAGGASNGAAAVIIKGASHNCGSADGSAAEEFVAATCRVLREAAA